VKLKNLCEQVIDKLKSRGIDPQGPRVLPAILHSVNEWNEANLDLEFQFSEELVSRVWGDYSDFIKATNGSTALRSNAKDTTSCDSADLTESDDDGEIVEVDSEFEKTETEKKVRIDPLPANTSVSPSLKVDRLNLYTRCVFFCGLFFCCMENCQAEGDGEDFVESYVPFLFLFFKATGIFFFFFFNLLGHFE
jgi:hypothetical protein